MSSTITTLSKSQIQSLLAAETKQLEQPITNWQSEIKEDQTKISAWGKIGGALSTLASAVDDIKDPASFDNRAASSADKGVATASAARGAAPGTYLLTQVQPAQNQSIYSQSYASASASLGSGAGTLTFTLASGKTETVSVAADDATPDGIAEAVNAVSTGNIQASIVGGSTGDRLVFTSASTGAAAAFSVSGTGSLASLVYAAGGSANSFTVATAASDASMDVNGVPVSNTGNKFTQAIPGATVTLTGPGSTSIAVTETSSKLAGAVSAVVANITAAVQAIQTATAFNPTGPNGNGPLLGNFSATNIAVKLESAVSGLSDGGVSARDMGITVNKDGTVSFDASTFVSAYQANPQAVETLVGSLYTRVNAVTQATVGSTVTGVVPERKNAIQADVKNLNSQISQKADFVQQQIQNAADEFSHLLSVQSRYSVWNNYLNAIFTSSGDDNG